MYDPAHTRSRTVQPIGGNFKPDLTLKTCLVLVDCKFGFAELKLEGSLAPFRLASKFEDLQLLIPPFGDSKIHVSANESISAPKWMISS